MSNNQAPAGWFPDPEVPGQLRYWDGVQWTEHRSPMPSGQPVPQGQPVIGDQQGPVSQAIPARRVPGTWWQWTLGVLALLIIVGALGDGETSETTPASDSYVAEEAAPAEDTAEDDTTEDDTTEDGAATESGAQEPAAEDAAEKKAKPEPKPAPKPVGPRIPALQKRFMAAVTTAQDKAEDADNDLQLGAALSTRNNQAICSMVGRGAVRGWVGEVSTLDANGDGKGILEIELADDVQVGTWNNFLSDAVDETLIEPGPLFDKIIGLEEGQRVRFSGELVEELGGDPCINDSRMTLYGKVSDPFFIFRFSDVRPIS
jgi:hypothetical protein